ncbi:putative Ankyrin repeat protein [Seiridium unicorne]|uniref:Ankyrin repeat protein n=1 Tax=Seiridium unicorne TaxID=138068 RepID=A0ABR2VAQ6_9PEZI
MASFFALDIDKFPKDDDGDTNWPLGLVVGILFGISLSVIIPLYALAFFSENLQRAWSKICGVWMPLTTLPIIWALNKIPFMTLGRLWIFAFIRSYRNLFVVQRYDPKFEQNIEHEEDDLIRLWTTNINSPHFESADFSQAMVSGTLAGG